ncbi:hypothetical protein LCGC14_2157800, partial [marine sediment metagenome]
LGATAGATPANFFEGVIGADCGWRLGLTDAQVLEAHNLLIGASATYDETLSASFDATAALSVDMMTVSETSLAASFDALGALSIDTVTIDETALAALFDPTAALGVDFVTIVETAVGLVEWAAAFGVEFVTIVEGVSAQVDMTTGSTDQAAMSDALSAEVELLATITDSGGSEAGFAIVLRTLRRDPRGGRQAETRQLSN